MLSVKTFRSFKLWRYQPANIGKDWKIHRDELKIKFIILCNNHQHELIERRGKQPRKILLQKLLNEWNNCNNEIEMLKIILQIGYHCFEVKDKTFYVGIREILREI